MPREEALVKSIHIVRLSEGLEASDDDFNKSTGGYVEQTCAGDVGEVDVLGFSSHGWERDDGVELEGVGEKPEEAENEEEDKPRSVKPLSLPFDTVHVMGVDVDVVVPIVVAGRRVIVIVVVPVIVIANPPFLVVPVILHF